MARGGQRTARPTKVDRPQAGGYNITNRGYGNFASRLICVPAGVIGPADISIAHSVTKRQSTGALQNVAVFVSVHYALAFWTAAVLRRFPTLEQFRFEIDLRASERF